MKKVLSISILLVIMLLPACAQQKTIKYADEIFYKLAATPEEFQRVYGGTLQYYFPEEKIRDKDEADQQAYIKNEEFRVFWKWQHNTYVPELIEFTSNRFLIDGQRIIGKKKDQMISIFGEPNKSYPSSIVYNGSRSYIAFSFKNDVVTICSMGLR